MLRVLPIEMACYASDEEITKAIKPLIAQYFPQETQNPLKVTFIPFLSIIISMMFITFLI